VLDARQLVPGRMAERVVGARRPNEQQRRPPAREGQEGRSWPRAPMPFRVPAEIALSGCWFMGSCTGIDQWRARQLSCINKRTMLRQLVTKYGNFRETNPATLAFFDSREPQSWP